MRSISKGINVRKKKLFQIDEAQSDLFEKNLRKPLLSWI
jgi:hypothetical protein